MNTTEDMYSGEGEVKPEQAIRPLWMQRMTSCPSRSHVVRVAGVNVHYRQWGVEQAQDDRPVVLLVHGFLAHTYWWDGVAPALLERFRVYGMDLSGMGDSGHRTVYSNALWAQEIAAIAATVSTRPVALVAHSFGGSRALEACLSHPEFFKHLTLIDSYIHFTDYPNRPASYKPTGRQRSYASLLEAISRYRLMPNEPVSPWMLEYVARHSLRVEDGRWIWKFDELNLHVPRGEADSTELLRRYPVPMALIHGAKSHIATEARMQRIAGLVPCCTGVVSLGEANHHLMLSEPQELADALLQVIP